MTRASAHGGSQPIAQCVASATPETQLLRHPLVRFAGFSHGCARKAVSPLRSATALQISDRIATPHFFCLSVKSVQPVVKNLKLGFAVQFVRVAHFKQDSSNPLPLRFLCAHRGSAVYLFGGFGCGFAALRLSTFAPLR